MMAGFVPLLSLPRLPTFVHQLVDKVNFASKRKTKTLLLLLLSYGAANQ